MTVKEIPISHPLPTIDWLTAYLAYLCYALLILVSIFKHIHTFSLNNT